MKQSEREREREEKGNKIKFEIIFYSFLFLDVLPASKKKELCVAMFQEIILCV